MLLQKIKEIIKSQNQYLKNKIEEEKEIINEFSKLGIKAEDNTYLIGLLENQINTNKEELKIIGHIEKKQIDNEIIKKRENIYKKILYIEMKDNNFKNLELLLKTNYGLYYISFDNENELQIDNLSNKKNGFHISPNGKICKGTWKNLLSKIDEYSIITFIEMLLLFLNFDDKKYHYANENDLKNKENIDKNKIKHIDIKNKDIKKIINSYF